MLVFKAVRSSIVASSSIFLLMGMMASGCVIVRHPLMGLMASDASAFTKSSCTGCGCKYERDCESGPQGEWCWTSCLCPAGTPDSCMGNKLSGLRGVKISKSASQTIYRLKVAPEK